MHGPEFQNGWATKLDLPNGTPGEALLRAEHLTRHRLPRGHEIARMMTRGRPMAMVDETTHKWAVIFNKRPIGTISVLTNRCFRAAAVFGHIHSPPQGYATVRAAAEAVIDALIAHKKRAQENNTMS